jgi:hypothetical protein
MIRLARPTDLAGLADIERSAGRRFLGTAMAWAAGDDPVPLAVLEQAQAAGLLWIAEAAGGQAAVCEHARAAGYRSVVLTTDRELPWNAPFYRRHGFAELPPDRLPAPLAARLRLEAEAGFDPARRCAMACPTEA